MASTDYVSALGAGSGMDVKALATSLVDAERVPRKDAIDKKVKASEANISGYGAIKYVLDGLKTAFADLNDQSDFSSIQTSNSQSTAFSVNASATTAAGNHSVEITQIAKAQRNISAGFALATTPLNGAKAFNLSLSVHGGDVQNIEIPEGFTTPIGVVACINGSAKGVKAQLINTGDASAPYKIMVTGTTGAANDFTLSSGGPPSAVTTSTVQGAVNTREVAQLSFGPLTSGQSVSVNGLSFTAGVGGASAADVAAAFQNIAGATTSADVAAAYSAAVGAGNEKGSFAGSFAAGFSTGSSAAGTTVTATSASADGNVADLSATSATPGAVSKTITQGASDTTESTVVTMTFAKALTSGQTMTVNGLTFTAGASGASATEVASAFANIASGASDTTVNAAYAAGGAVKGSFSGSFTAGFFTGAATGTAVTATATASGPVADLATSSSVGGVASLQTNRGAANLTESSVVSFAKGLAIGQSVSVAGLTYTATSDTTLAQLAAAFASLASGATTGAGTATGSYSGAFTGFSTGSATGASVTATSASASRNVSDLVATSATTGVVSAVTTQGASNATESTLVSFSSGLSAGQSVTIGGLTYKSTAATTAAELAAAFANIASDASATAVSAAYASAVGSANVKGSFSGVFTGFSTGSANGSTVTATSASANTKVSPLVVTVMDSPGLDFGSKLESVQDARLIVNGVAITSASNRVTEAIAGVTINVTTTTTGAGTANNVPASLNFTRDTSAVKTKLQALVSAYNDANTMLGVVSDPKSTVETYGATLVGNSTVFQIRTQMRALITGNSNSPSGGISALRDLGINLDKSGVLQLDAVKLDAALTGKFDNVVTMLSANRENLSAYSSQTAGVAGEAVRNLTKMLGSEGVLTTQSSSATKRIDDYKKQLAKLEERMADLLARYNKQFSAMQSIVGETKSVASGLTNMTAQFNKSN